MPEERIKVEAGFLELVVSSPQFFASTSYSPSPHIRVEVGNKTEVYSVSFLNSTIIPLPAGRVKLTAIYGMIITETKEIEIKTGETKKVVFEFG